MIALDPQIRRRLENAVGEARTAAEEAARKALHTLGVDEPDAPRHLDADHRQLRIQLRAQARQLGDGEDPHKKGRYQIKHLAEKIGYDQWHRLLFARFLIENDLLISPQHQVGVSLNDCQELAPELGLRDGWEVAARFTANLLPEIFRTDDPAGRIEFAPEDKAALRKIVIDLPREVFVADDSLGWVYQFWQAQRKDEVNASGDKISADELAPVTQLFTEDYMVLFLLHNTLGAWWAARQLDNIQFRKPLVSEAEAREVVALPGVKWDYLRFIHDDGGNTSPPPNSAHWRPAAGNFASWPKTAKELRVLDPCMGSGHFKVAELPILVAMRMAEEGLSVADACEAVLRDNLFGLELDPRCTQIAAFNLALAAWKLGGYRPLPPLNLACCGPGINARKDDWAKLANGDKSLRYGMEQLFELFQKAPDLGSLINPKSVGGPDEFLVQFHDLQPLLKQALDREDAKKNPDPDLHEMGVTARGLAHAAEILAGQFTLVATNVPYLGRGKQDDVLREFCERHHPDAWADLATCFIERCLDFCATSGTTALVTPQNWLFLGRYRSMREGLLRRTQWNFLIRLGPGAFETISGEVVKAAMLSLSSSKPLDSHRIAGLDVSNKESPEEKAAMLAIGEPASVSQKAQFLNPDARLVLETVTHHDLLGKYAISMRGIVSGDTEYWMKCWWELSTHGLRWRFIQSTVESACNFGGRHQAIDWSTEGRGMLRPGTKNEAYGCRGIVISLMNCLQWTLFGGDLYDNNCGTIVPRDPKHLAAVVAFCSSPEFTQYVRRIDQKLNVTNATLVKVPFDMTHWQKVAAEKYLHGLPKPHSDDPTQWLFNGHPKGSNKPLQVALARLLGYRWPRQTGSSFPDCPALDKDGLEKFTDDDGIVCINAIKGEQPAAERLRALLATAFGRDWNAAKQTELLTAVGYAGSTLEDWLRTGFFDQHCQLFHHRPFIWHIWDGLRDGFSALVNYHQLDRKMLEKLTYTYLGDWISRQKAAVEAGEEGSDAKLAAAQGLKASLEKIIEGEAPHDIFVRWKPLEKQPVGWNPDLNDGVRMNIRPFMSVDDVAKKGAGILRSKPNIKWDKDRGKDVATAPWFHKFKGERINDHHLMLDEKRKGKKGN